jgi:hypothetical protein
MNNFISFAIVVFMLSVPLFSLSAFGADNVTSNKSQINVDQFVTYDNSTRGIKIDYPKDWTVIDQFGLRFFSPKENDSDTFREGLLVSKGPHGNQSIDKLAAGVLAIYNSSLPNFKLIESKGLTFHGNPAENLIYTFNPGNGTIKVLESGATENNSIYIFQYRAQENKFDSYLPTIQRMIDSFKATK